MAADEQPTPDDKPDHPHDVPPGQDPDFVPPGHGGEPPGQEGKPDPDEEPHPEHPIVEPPPPVVEPHLSLSTFGVTKHLRPAHTAALRSWMQANYHDPDGHYPLANWEGMYQDMLTHTPPAS